MLEEKSTALEDQTNRQSKIISSMETGVRDAQMDSAVIKEQAEPPIRAAHSVNDV